MNNHMLLLESRARRLTELLEIAAPSDMIYNEIMLLTEAAKPLAPKSWGKGYGQWPQQEGNNENQEEFQSSYRKCATG